MRKYWHREIRVRVSSAANHVDKSKKASRVSSSGPFLFLLLFGEHRRPLRSPECFVLNGFLEVHLVLVLLVDLQPLYPAWLVLGPSKRLLEYYIGISNDPLTLGLMGRSRHYIWFKSFLFLEA